MYLTASISSRGKIHYNASAFYIVSRRIICILIYSSLLFLLAPISQRSYMKSRVFSVLVVVLSLSAVPSDQISFCREEGLVRYVRDNGTNTPACLISSNPRDTPCRTINYALLEDDSEGTVVDDDCSSKSVTPDNLCIRLEDGVHRLTGEAQATGMTGLVIEAVNPHRATIRCRRFPNDTPGQFDNLALICSTNILLDGVIVENCGPANSGIYAQFSEDITIQNTIFRLVDSDLQQ